MKAPAHFVPRLLHRIARSKLAWGGATLLLFYALGGFVLAPYLIERFLPSLAEEHLGRGASVETVRINPFLLTFEASGFRLEGGEAKPLLAFRTLFVDLELSSLVDRAWTFGDVRLEGADLALEIDRDGRLNLVDIIERLRNPEQPAEAPPRLVLQRVSVTGAAVSLVDHSGAKPASAAATHIALELYDLTTLPDRRGRYTLAAALSGGGALEWEGQLSLQPMASSGDLRLQGFRIETAWQFMRDALNLEQPQGALTLAGHYDLRYAQGKANLAVSALQAELSGLSLALRGEALPLVAMRTLRVSDAHFALEDRELVVNKLLLADGALNAGVSEAGRLDWQQVVAAASPAPRAAATPAPGSSPPWRIRLQDIAFDGIALAYTDRSKQPALTVRTAALNGGLKLDLTTGAPSARVIADGIRLALATTAVTTPGADAPLAALDALTLSGGRIDTQTRAAYASAVAASGGHVTLALGPDGPLGLMQMFAAPTREDKPAPGGEPWRVELAQVGIDKVALRYTDGGRTPALALRVTELNAGFKLDATVGAEATRMVAGDLRVAVTGIALAAHGTDAPLASLESFSLGAGHVDTGERSVRAATVALTGGAMKLGRGHDGATGLLAALLPPQPQRSVAAPATVTRAQNAWRYQVDALALERVALALSDRTYTPALTYDVDVISAAATNIDNASKAPIAFSTELRIGERGSAKGTGTLRQDFSGAGAQVELSRLGLEPLRPVLARYATLDLESGSLSASARVAYERDAQPSLTAAGRASVADFLVNESDSGERLASWKMLTGNDIVLNLSPDKLAIRELSVLQPGAKIVIHKDRTINLTDVLRKDTAPDGGVVAAPAQAAASSAADTARAPFPYEIERIRLENGTLDFADLSLVLPFATQVQALGGAIVGLSSAPGARAELKLAGQIDAYGEARAEGVLIPRSPATFLDIRADFENVQMPLLSPYAATFAGRKVAAGKLSLTLEYKILDSQLAGENQIVLRDFRLGERVEAPDALDLPLDLAIALLKDSEGKISLAVPVRGNVGSPEFDYGAVIRGAIGNAIGRVVTAPFRMLAGLFGKADAEAIRTVEFEAGSERISPAQREQLDVLAKALKERPQLRLVVRGPYDTERDARALKRERARLELAAELGTTLRTGEDPGPIAYGSAATQKALQALLSRRAGSAALDALSAAYAKRTGRAPDRLNPVLGLLGRGSNDREFYEAMFARLAEAEPLSDTAVRVLAVRRAQGIVEMLIKSGIERERVQSGGIAQVDAGTGSGIATALALDVMPGASERPRVAEEGR